MERENNTSGGDKYSKLAGNTIIFAISSFSSKLLTLLVQPFLTYAMAEISDLGLSKILSQYANLLIPFVSMGMSNAIIRFGLDKGNSEKQVFTNGLLTILGGFGILILCWPIAQFLPDMAQYGFLIYIYVLMSCLRTLCTQFVRSRQWNKLVAVDGILCTFATLMFYVLYLVGFHWGANGYLLAIISGDFVSVLFLCVTGKLWNYVELRGLNKTLWRQMLRFSLPMIPAQISFWVINASDLFFVREMCNGLGDNSGDVLGEAGELGVATDEVGLAGDLDESGNLAVLGDIGGDGALVGLTAGLLDGLGHTHLTENVDGLLDVAIGLDEGLLALHHRGIGHLAELLDERGGDLSHV